MRVIVFGLAVMALTIVYATTGLQSVRAEPVPDAQAGATDKDPNLATLAYRIGSFRQFLFAAGMTDLDDELKGEGPWTVFAPTDEAIGKLAPGLWFKLLKPENRDMLKRVLRF
ncbi:MAG: fasciclin domain-containing protein, partial [Pseudomonadota bacterium]